MAAKSSPGGFVVATVTNPGSFMTSRYVQTSLPMNIIKFYMNIINYPYYEYQYGHCASIGSMFCASHQQGSSVGHEEYGKPFPHSWEVILKNRECKYSTLNNVRTE